MSVTGQRKNNALPGAIQKGLPIMVFLCIIEDDSWAETPKSAILALPFKVSNMFPDLISL